MWSEILVHPERQGRSKKMAPAQRTVWKSKKEFQGRKNLGETSMAESHSHKSWERGIQIGASSDDALAQQFPLEDSSWSLCAPLSHQVGRHGFIFIHPLPETLSWGLPELGQEEEVSKTLEGDSRYGESWHHPPQSEKHNQTPDIRITALKGVRSTLTVCFIWKSKQFVCV